VAPGLADRLLALRFAPLPGLVTGWTQVLTRLSWHGWRRPIGSTATREYNHAPTGSIFIGSGRAAVV